MELKTSGQFIKVNISEINLAKAESESSPFRYFQLLKTKKFVPNFSINQIRSQLNGLEKEFLPYVCISEPTLLPAPPHPFEKLIAHRFNVLQRMVVIHETLWLCAVHTFCL